jgi:nitrogen fixation NifU-like protein
MFGDDKITLNKNWKEFSEIFDKKNIARKECLLLPLRTVLKALEI